VTPAFRIRRALLSVTDKTGVAELGRALVAGDVQLVASGGTAEHLRAAGVPVTPLEELTGAAEILGGRVKTLHARLLAGILADRENRAHVQELEAQGIPAIDLVVVNFYAFAETARTAALPVEAIDIGGPNLVRAAAKNFGSVAVLSDPRDYPEFLDAWRQGRVDLGFRRRLAARGFARVAAYDCTIAERFARLAPGGEAAGAPPTRRPGVPLRYGENPHQQAEAWIDAPAWGLGAMHQTGGEELSFNNLVDADAALDLVFDLGDRPACAIIKHTNPCGAAVGATAADAFRAAHDCDPVSAYGGVVAFNFSLDAEAADAVAGHFFELVCAPAIDPVAREILRQKKRVRILEVPRETWCPAPGRRVERALHGMTLVQERDLGFPELDELQVVTRAQPTPAELADAAFALAVVKHVRSNAIVIARDGRTLGIGAGQMSRVDSCDLAVRKALAAGHELAGSVAASDAFFPFADGVERLVAAGVRVVVQPGGSKRDAEVVAAADGAHICMLLSGRRHFRH
jgi:phosphoribosylaminoimidazolecarboxamide formyltransferase / IMP cyclohydrolase